MVWRKSLMMVVSPVLFAGLAVVINLVFSEFMERTIALVFVLAIVASAWTSGLAGGLFTSAVGIITIDYLYFAPRYAFSLLTIEEGLLFLTFLSLSFAVSCPLLRMRKTEARLRYALESASDGFWDWNVKSGVVYFSPQWIASLGYGPTEIQNDVRFWESLIHPDDVGHTFDMLKEHFEGKTPIYICENRLRLKSGAYRWNLDRGKVVEWDSRGRPVRMVGVDIDISERKRAEDDRAARRKAEAIAKSKDDFISMVSHELRNPLSTIAMGAEILKTESDDPQSVQLATETIARATKIQTMLVNDLLDWSRLMSGKFDLHRQPSSIASIIDAAKEVVSGASESKGLKWTVNIDPAVDKVDVDSARMTQVMWNLFSNAVKFTPDRGHITVDVHADGKRGVEISVTDTGRGIAAAQMPQLFDPFWQSRVSDSRSLGGLGLGLSIVRAIVNEHGGRVWAESKGPGDGTTFRISLENCVIQPQLHSEPLVSTLV